MHTVLYFSQIQYVFVTHNLMCRTLGTGTEATSLGREVNIYNENSTFRWQHWEFNCNSLPWKIFCTKGQDIMIKSNRRKYTNQPQWEAVCIDNEKNIRILNYRPNSFSPEGKRTFPPKRLCQHTVPKSGILYFESCIVIREYLYFIISVSSVQSSVQNRKTNNILRHH